MLNTIKFELEGELDEGRNDFLGSLLQGFIMENIDSGYAGSLHESSLHPYSQYITEDNGKAIWTLNTLSIEAKENIADIIKSKNLIYLKHKDKHIKIKSFNEEGMDYSDMVKKYYLQNHKRMLKIRFLTPTSFKQDGRYCIFPSVRLIFQSLMLKFDKAATDMEVFSKSVLENFEEYIEISGYKLRSTFFHLEGVRIPSFMGEITLNINGPAQLVNLAHMLVFFGTYSGVGIKAGIGMGGIAYNE